MKPKKKWNPSLVILFAVIIALAGTLAAGYTYLLGNMERDSFVSPEELSVVDTSNIVRETMPETTENGILGEDGNVLSGQLPEEALAVLRGESGGTGIHVPDAEPETVEETTPETETETKPETKKETTSPAPETQKETKPPETKPVGDAVTIGSSVSYLKPGANKIKTFVLYGLDAKKASDVIILMALDTVHNKCKIISIARDTYAYLSEQNAHAKLTYAHSMGGAALAVRTLNENFHLHMEDYIAVNFEQAEDVIDLLGGAEVYLDEKEIKSLQFSEDMAPGLHKLNGNQAVRYARLRSIDNDLVRNDRQREVIKSIFSNFRNLKITDYPALFREAAGMCATSFTDTELISLGTTFLSMKGCTFEQYNFPNANTSCWGGLIDDLFYWVYDLAKVSDEIYRIIYEDLYVSGYTAR